MSGKFVVGVGAVGPEKIGLSASTPVKLREKGIEQ